MKNVDELLKGLLDDDSTWEEMCDYIRSGISVDEMRYALLGVERMIKDIATDLDGGRRYFFPLFSETETDLLEDLLGTRGMILNEMMKPKPTEEEVERLNYQNEKLLGLVEEARKHAEILIHMFYSVPLNEEERTEYDLEKWLEFTWGDTDAVIKMSNDDYYGSDFSYMMKLIDTIKSRTICLNNLLIECCGLPETMEDALKQNQETMEDGVTWADGYLHNDAFKDICICHPIHCLYSHLHYSIPDILRMNDFAYKVTLTYEKEICEGRECPQ